MTQSVRFCTDTIVCSDILAVLLLVFESLVLLKFTPKVALVPLAVGSGVIGICTISFPSPIIFVVLLHVTCLVVVFIVPQDHPLSTKAELGPLKFIGIVKRIVWIPEDERLPALLTVTGMRDG